MPGTELTGYWILSPGAADVILRLYLALVRPHSVYAMQFLSPYYEMDIVKLEAVHRRMTKMIQEIKNLTYEGKLKHLNIHYLGGSGLVASDRHKLATFLW